MRAGERGRLGTWALALAVVAAGCGGGGKAPVRASRPAAVAPGAEAPALLPAEQAPAPGETQAPAGAVTGKRTPRGGAGAPANLKPGPSSGGAPAAYQGEVGVTKDTITIGFIYARSGPYQALMRNYDLAVQAAFDEANDAGGIHGRKLVPVFGDDGYDNPSLALGSAKDLAGKAFGVATVFFNTWAAVHDFLEEKGVPNLYMMGDRSKALRSRYQFALPTFLQTMAEGLPRFMLSRLGAQGKKVGVMVADTPDLQPVAEAFVHKAQQTGLEVVIVQKVSETPATCVNEVQRVQQAGAQVVALFMALPAVCIIRDAETIGYRPTWTGFPYQAKAVSVATGCKTDGITAPSFQVTLEQPEGVRYANTMRKRYPNNPDAADDEVAFLGWGLANFWIEAARRAGPTPTRESFVAGMETMRGWTTGQFAPKTFGPGDRMGSRGAVTIKGANCSWVTIDPVWRSEF